MICAQWPAWSQPIVAAVCILFFVPYIFGSTLRCETIGVLCDLFLLNLFSCRILPTCRRALVGLQIDECNIVGRHHQCVTAIRLACGNLPEFLSLLVCDNAVSNAVSYCMFLWFDWKFRLCRMANLWFCFVLSLVRFFVGCFCFQRRNANLAVGFADSLLLFLFALFVVVVFAWFVHTFLIWNHSMSWRVYNSFNPLAQL